MWDLNPRGLSTRDSARLAPTRLEKLGLTTVKYLPKLFGVERK